jgi:pimeloyl-ACP methyl ester carboxylesterase
MIEHNFMDPMEQRAIRTNGIRVNTWLGGSGAPVVLLHGYPQTGQMWRKVAPRLLDDFAIVCPDLRGYGDSDKPRDGYDKRTMARDIHLLMESLGHKRYAVVGHDRGARVSHRLALDPRGGARGAADGAAEISRACLKAAAPQAPLPGGSGASVVGARERPGSTQRAENE